MIHFGSKESIRIRLMEHLDLIETDFQSLGPCPGLAQQQCSLSLHSVVTIEMLVRNHLYCYVNPKVADLSLVKSVIIFI